MMDPSGMDEHQPLLDDSRCKPPAKVGRRASRRLLGVSLPVLVVAVLVGLVSSAAAGEPVATASGVTAPVSHPSCSAAPGGGLTLANVASARGMVRVVGANGLIARATAGDLGRWRRERTGLAHNLRGIAWTGARWVAVGDAGSILYRARGRWISVPGLPSTGLRGIAARPGLVAAAGSGGVLLTSANGITWSVGDSGVSGLLWGGTRVGSTLAFSGQDSAVVSSADGLSWSPVSVAPPPTGNPIAPRPLLWQLAASGRHVVGVGDFGAIVSGTLAGGLTAVHSSTDEILRGIVHSGRAWVAVGSGGTILVSRDGRHWAKVTAPVNLDLRGVTWTGRRFVAVGDEGTVISSRDGRRWQVDESAMPCALLGVAAGAGRVVAVGGSGRVQLRDANGRWREARLATDQDLYAVTRGPGRFVAVGADATVLSSSTGRRWARQRVPAALNLHAVGWTGRGYLAGGDRGLLLSSRDGTHWRRQSFPGFHSIRGFATDGTSVVAAGAGTVATRSSRDAKWELLPVGLGHFQTGVAYGNGRYLVVGHNGEVLESTDGGTTWQPQNSGVSQNLDAIVWTGRRFIATGEGVAITSTNGTQWRSLPSVSSHSIRALAVWRRSVVGVGDLNAHVQWPAG